MDGAGHGIGWGTKDYFAAMKKTDERIANIVNAVKQAGIIQQTAIIVTSDHGGVNKGHGGDDLKEMKIPWIIYGAGIKKNNQLTETVVIYDTAATIAWIFGLNPPQVWTGRPVRSAFQ